MSTHLKDLHMMFFASDNPDYMQVYYLQFDNSNGASTLPILITTILTTSIISPKI